MTDLTISSDAYLGGNRRFGDLLFNNYAALTGLILASGVFGWQISELPSNYKKHLGAVSLKKTVSSVESFFESKDFSDLHTYTDSDEVLHFSEDGLSQGDLITDDIIQNLDSVNLDENVTSTHIYPIQHHMHDIQRFISLDRPYDAKNRVSSIMERANDLYDSNDKADVLVPFVGPTLGFLFMAGLYGLHGKRYHKVYSRIKAVEDDIDESPFKDEWNALLSDKRIDTSFDLSALEVSVNDWVESSLQPIFEEYATSENHFKRLGSDNIYHLLRGPSTFEYDFSEKNIDITQSMQVNVEGMRKLIENRGSLLRTINDRPISYD